MTGGAAVAIEVTPLTGTLGAEVSGVDLRGPLGDEAGRAVGEALTRHKVLFFRGQELTADEQLAFASSFGPPMVARGGEMVALAQAPDAPSPFVTLEDSAASPPKADHWHTDVPFVAEPPDIAVLCMLASPPVGGDTLWVDLHAVFEALSPAMQRLLSGLELEVGVGAPVKAGYAGREGGDEAYDRLVREVPPVRHPLVRAHPVTGRPALWWAGREFIRGVAGLHPDESEALLAFLESRLDDPNHQCRWRWRDHDVAMWDERCTNHRAVSDHHPAFRSVRRCLVGQGAPAGVAAGAGGAGLAGRAGHAGLAGGPPGKELADLGVPAEELYGLSQAVRSGDTIHVSGQTASGSDAAGGDLAAQMRQAYAKVAEVLSRFGAGLGDVVDEVLLVTDVDAAVRVAPEVRREAYGGRPEVASTLVEVSRLAGPGLLVEVKCTARVPS